MPNNKGEFHGIFYYKVKTTVELRFYKRLCFIFQISNHLLFAFQETFLNLKKVDWSNTNM